MRVALLIMAVLSLGPLAFPQIKTAKVTGGKVQGIVEDGISIFKGIPFAAPPVGELRWKAPQPVKGWPGIRMAEAFAPGCVQDTGMAKMMGAPVSVSEDCLYLNVWTPARSVREKYPVIVWIYGGGFSGGMTSVPMYDGKKLAQKGAVVISIAYRVGPFGFLAHPELSRESGKGSGNYGLQDMIAGLKWVKANAEKFGGDSKRVTIFGHSAGGMAVSMLSASPAAKGLFHHAISMSGGSFAPPRIADEAGQMVPSLKLAESQGEAFLKKLGANDIKAARALSADEIHKGLTGFSEGRFWPVADANILPGDQYELYLAGRFNDTSILIGTTSDEAGTFSPKPVTAAEFEKQVRANYGPQAEAILKAYPHSNDAEATRSSKGLMRENTFAWHTWAWAKLQSQKGKGKAYVYFFDRHTAATPDGAGHGTDVPYAFQTLTGAPAKEDAALSDMISSYLVNFAGTGDPNGEGLPEWPSFSESDQKVMFFDEQPSVRPIPNLDKLKALDGYYSWRREQAKKART
ncbi:MAG: carboxylesterase family protein [Acidobacteria bacterium]|nr:carboxylesterase family protein [Acidobacteriota bacterium]